MPDFAYTAIDETGAAISGVIEAASSDRARELLGSKGYIPSRVAPARAKGGGARGGLWERLSKIKPPDLILFTKQFRTMFRAGVAIVNLLETLELQTENPKLKRVSCEVVRDIRDGKSLYEALKKHPEAFSELYCAMVRAGETSGALPEALERLTYIISHEHKIKKDIRSALNYPIIVVLFLIAAFFVLLIVVIPKFVMVFQSAGLELPIPTRICILMYDTVVAYWHLGLGAVIVAGVALSRYVRTQRGRLNKDSLLLRLPVFGPLFLKAAMSRFASIFAILQGSGVTVLNSMDILSGTIGNAAISGEFDKVRARLEEGQGISAPLQKARYFTPMVIHMVAIGEESGSLDEMLREISVHYDDEVEYAVSRLSEMITPILTVGLAGVVCFFALSVFLPMWDLMKMVK